MPGSVAIAGSGFWSSISHPNLYSDGGLLYVVLNDSVEMHIILRTAEEIFEDTVNREVAAQHLIVAVNGNFYDVSRSGLIDAAWGHDPVVATEATPIGWLVEGSRLIGGRPAPNHFFVANSLGPLFYGFAFGNPPTGLPVRSAIGGAGPLIIDGLKYGNGNLYRAGASPSAPATGQPSVADRVNLIQRNNATYAALAQRPAETGKTVIAHCSSQRKLLILVQGNGTSSGIALDALRDKLFDVGIDNAVFLDGSDSAMLVHSGTFYVRQGPNKDETNTIGVGFTSI